MIHLRSVFALVREAVAEWWAIADFLVRKADDRWVLAGQPVQDAAVTNDQPLSLPGTTTCDACGAIVADLSQHQAWHGQLPTPDTIDERIAAVLTAIDQRQRSNP